MGFGARRSIRRVVAVASSALAIAGCAPSLSPQDLAFLFPAAAEVSFALNGYRQFAPSDLLVDSLVFPVDPAAGEYPRIPGIVEANDGTLVAVASIRRGSIADDAPSSLRAAVSRDGGRTWTHHDIAENPTTADGDHAVVVDPATGRVFVFGRDLYTSDDGGVTWTARPKVIAANPAGIVGEPGGPGAGIALARGPHAGRLVVMCRAQTGPLPPSLFGLLTIADRTNATNCVLTSDDGGATWQTSGVVQGWVGEGSVIELDDGRLYMSSRTYLLDGRRSEAYSSDGGTTWTDLRRSVLPEPTFGVNGSLTRVTDPDTGRPVVVYANVPEWDSPFGIVALARKDLSLYVSDDETASWRFGRVLRRGPSAYSSMVPLGSEVGVLYEAVISDLSGGLLVPDLPNGIRFARVDVRSLLR